MKIECLLCYKPAVRFYSIEENRPTHLDSFQEEGVKAYALCIKHNTLMTLV